MRVRVQVVEGNRKRTQVFEGVVIPRRGAAARETFTVRKHRAGSASSGPSPFLAEIERVEVIAKGKVRRPQLYYLRGRVGKRARVAERRWGIEDDLVIAEPEADAVDSEGMAQSEAESTPAAEGEEEEAAEAQAGEAAEAEAP